MNWEAVNAISQLVSSIAVVFSVLYLGIQVHRSTRVAKLATQDAAATALRDVTKPLMENAELERIWRVGLEDLNTLSAQDQARFFHATYQFLKAFGIAHYWKLRPEVFSERFRKFVNALEPPAEQRTVGNLFGQERKL